MKWLFLFLSCLGCFGQEYTRGLSIRILGSSANTGNDASETTPTYDLRVNTELIAVVINSKASAPDQPAVVGNSLVWTEIFDTNYLSTHRMTIWYAKCGSGAVDGTFSANTGATAQTGWAIAVFEVEGTRITGVNGVDSIRQSVNANVSAGTSITATFGALGKRTLGVGLLGANLNGAAMSAEAGWTKLRDINYNTPATELTIVYQLKNADTTCNIGNASAFSGCIVGLELVQDGNFP
jgi:hypothetical protein